jgi:hypothetical protein
MAEVEVQGEVVVDAPGVPAEEGVPAEQNTEEVILPSDTPEFEMPEKFAGKSAEEVARAYVELEKMKKGGDPVSKEEEETSPKTEETQYQKYAESLDKNGSLSEAEYAELAEAGYDKATVDAEIKRRAELKEFEAYKAEKTLNEVLEPLGGGVEKFKEVTEWAAKSKTPEEIKTFNEALASVPKIAQQAMLKGLYEEYASSNKEATILHTNSPQTRPASKYTTQEEFFKDVGSEEYKNNPAYRAAVEKKMSLSDIF